MRAQPSSGPSSVNPSENWFRKLDDAGKAALEREILALLAESNVAGETSLVVPSAYLEVIVTKR